MPFEIYCIIIFQVRTVTQDGIKKIIVTQNICESYYSKKGIVSCRVVELEDELRILTQDEDSPMQHLWHPFVSGIFVVKANFLGGEKQSQLLKTGQRPRGKIIVNRVFFKPLLI